MMSIVYEGNGGIQEISAENRIVSYVKKSSLTVQQ
jgi:hypothetical protein